MQIRLILAISMIVMLGAGLALLFAAIGAGEGEAVPANGQDRDAPLERFGTVWPGKMTRSGLPSKEGDSGGWRWLCARGVRSVVSFRGDNDIDYKAAGIERALWLPIRGNNPPSDKQAEQFLRFIQDPANQPVHIHCAEGKSRTGLMTALARYSVDGWPLEKALAEARLYRNGKELNRKQVEWLRQWAKQHPPGSHRSGQ
jgi:protein tyrosine/serine phosphatase